MLRIVKHIKDEYGVEFINDYDSTDLVGADLLKCPYNIRGEYIIPKGVIRIADKAFLGCNELTHIEIPHSVRYIEYQAFHGCTRLSSIIIPYGVQRIDSEVFTGCTRLKSIYIPSSVNSIGFNIIGEHGSLNIYTATNISQHNISSKSTSCIHIINVPQLYLNYYYPFSIYSKEFIDSGLYAWQCKGEYERTIDWQNRITEVNRIQKANDLLEEARQSYLLYYKRLIETNQCLGYYDADKEVFPVKVENIGIYYINVPLNEAKDFKESWNHRKTSCSLQIKDDYINVKQISITLPNMKEYIGK